jgi:hypothetical protein
MKQPGLLVSVLALVLVATSGAAFGFNNGNLNGPYAFSLEGTSSGNQVISIGRLIADGHGAIWGGNRTTVIGGVLVLHQTFTCTYSVNQDGTGTATCTVWPANPDGTTTETLAFVIVNGNQVQFISTQPGDVVQGVANHQG